MKRTLNLLLIAVMVVWTIDGASAQSPAKANAARTPIQAKQLTLTKFPVLNFAAAARNEAMNPPEREDDIEEIDEPQAKPEVRFGVPLPPGLRSKIVSQATPPSGLGPAPGPTKTFRAEFLSSTSIPPDTMGAVGTTHIVSVSNDRMRIQTRDGVELSRLTLTSFWAGVTIKGAAISAFDPKVLFDRFNNRFILIASGNAQSVNSGAMFAVSQTADPTGLWNRWSVPADPTSTATGGHWIDYPSMGFNKDWIVVNENVFNFGTAGGGFWGTQIYVLDKQAAYSNTLGTISLFEGDFNATCLTSGTPETELACGFTMAPAITEDNTTGTVYLVEDWDSTFGQLRLSKVTGTPAVPVMTVGTQFPQSPNSWRFNASRITNATTATTNGTTVTSSGGYVPQRQQSANLVSGTRMAANDSRIQNSVLRAGRLWTTHTVMLAVAAQPAGQEIGRLIANPPDTHSGVQWWQIDPTIETGLSTPPLQRAIIQDPTADNCHNGIGGSNIIAGRCTSTATQTGEFYAFPSISVNQNEDVFIGFTRWSPLTYPNSAYTIRRSSDPPNITRDIVVFNPGRSNYNIGAGASTAVHPAIPTRNNRWGDYSATQTDPLNDTDFWTVQEYSGTYRNDFLPPNPAAPWETWWAMVRPTTPAPSTAGSLIISEFRLRGPQGVRDEFVELYNPGATPLIVTTTDNTDGWALAYSSNGTTITSVFGVIPNGTVIPARGHLLFTNNPDGTPTQQTAVYSLSLAPSTQVRNADGDSGWALDLADNGGLGVFKTANSANFNASTRMDSAGFATIAAGLFREGVGIPAVTAATPAGQMTFHRNASSGLPVDTDANENDFIFADPVIEVLGATPRLGAAGPENLSAPIHETGPAAVVATLLDSGAGAGSPANRFRDPTPGPLTTSTFGTLTFRRTFTNNTGNDLPRLRYRIVNITTNPPGGGNADLRALSSVTGSVTLSGGGSVTVNGTTLETPPTQAVGGGFNSSYSANGIALATPLLAGASVNLQFTLGVQVTGNYNLCLIAEGVPFAASAVTCFAGTTENNPPSITPGGPLARNGGAPGTSDTIATVSDVEDPAGSLTVTAISVPAGISVTGISVDSGGIVTATVAADCTAAAGANNVILQVSDTQGATANATLVVNVTPTPAPPTPTISGPTSTCSGIPVILTANTTGATSYQWYRDTILLGGENASTISTSTAGSYTVDATNACGTSAQSAPHVLTVNPTPPTPTISGTLTFCTGSNTTLTSSSASGNQWYFNGNPLGGETNPTLVVSTAGDYTVQVTSGGCTSAMSAISTVTETPIPPTPTITPSGPTTFCAGGSVTLTSSSASGNQWYLNGNPIGGETNQTYVATASGDYTVVVTASGCPSAPSAVTTVTVNPIPPTPTITPGGPTTFCTGGSVTLTSSGGDGNQWYLDGNPIGGAINPTYVATASGNYTVVVTTSGCSSAPSAATTVTVNPIPPTPTITPSGPTTFCAGGSVTLTSSSASGNQWYLNGNPIGGETNQTYVATASGDYTVVVTMSGCSSAPSAATTVTVNPVPPTPTITPGGPTTFCAGGSVLLTSSSASGNQWYLNGSPIGGETNQTYTATASGDYTVVVTASGCSSNASAATTVTVNPLPNPTITSPSPIVTGSASSASVPNAGVGATYTWSITNGTFVGPTTGNSVNFTAGAPGILTLNVTVTTAAGCSDSDSVNITVSVAPPAVTVTNVSPNNGTYLGGTNVTITGTGFLAGASVTFDASAATSVVVVNSTTITAVTPAHAAGAVNVTVTNTDTTSGTLTNGYTYNPQQFDPNGDTIVDPSDIFYLVNYLFSGGPIPAGAAGLMSGDANGDSVVDPADIFYTVNYLFLGGPPPALRTGGGISADADRRLSGSVVLGTAVVREGRTFVPVTVTAASGSIAPQALALNLRVIGDGSVVAIRRAGSARNVQPAFEITRATKDGAAYLVAFDRGGVLGSSTVVAEIEIQRGGETLRIDIDPKLTLLSSGGVHQATVAAGTLQVRGVTVGATDRRPSTRERN
jgi:hypothetical protein